MHAAPRETETRKPAARSARKQSAAAPLVPKGIPPRPVDFCKECGNPYYPRREDQEFCGGTCRSKFHKRRQQRGTELYDFAMDWRGKRRKGGFTALCQMLDDWLRDNRVRKDAHRRIREAWNRQQKEQRQ
jgi:predicted nucleic acid-binding Zn ribbon protein